MKLGVTIDPRMTELWTLTENRLLETRLFDYVDASIALLDYKATPASASIAWFADFLKRLTDRSVGIHWTVEVTPQGTFNQGDLLWTNIEQIRAIRDAYGGADLDWLSEILVILGDASGSESFWSSTFVDNVAYQAIGLHDEFPGLKMTLPTLASYHIGRTINEQWIALRNAIWHLFSLSGIDTARKFAPVLPLTIYRDGGFLAAPGGKEVWGSEVQQLWENVHRELNATTNFDCFVRRTGGSPQLLGLTAGTYSKYEQGDYWTQVLQGLDDQRCPLAGLYRAVDLTDDWADANSEGLVDQVDEFTSALWPIVRWRHIPLFEQMVDQPGAASPMERI